MKPKIYKEGLVWICQNDEIVAEGISVLEAWNNFAQLNFNLQNWKLTKAGMFTSFFFMW